MYNPFSLENKTILVTGASSGIGKATAIECSKLGANVVISGRNEDRLKDTFNKLDTSGGQQHLMVVAELSIPEGIEALTAKLPNLNGFSSNVGTAIGNKPIKFIKEDDIKVIMQTRHFSRKSY